MTKPIPFDHNGGPLWISIEMSGLYFVTYIYQLWSADPSTPPILTNPLKVGSNEIPHDDVHPVINDYNSTEQINRYVDRIIDVRFWVKKGDNDDGYTLKVFLLQGQTPGTATLLGSDEVSGMVGASSIKEEFITLQLK
jgi:hypothetical protein